jgi:hypothetical protein
LSDLPALDDEAADDDGGGNVAGSLTADREISPERPALEHVAFVVLGVLVTVLVFILPIFTGGTPDLALVGAIGGGIVGLGAVLFYLFSRSSPKD